ncbi:MAG: type II secretion system protein [Planctomycetes bacterium]|nr:type II secretion system protein [Planctomycetota bacterium]MBI3847373.1 type II secretion system protein [Planctomycetota bacterium]
MRIRRGNPGFTMVELLVVIAVIATISSIILPSLLGARMSAAESAAMATLRTICSAETSFHERQSADRDADGEGEYGFLAEMAGTVIPPRAVQVVNPPMLPNSFRVMSSGYVSRTGYLFRVVLPGLGGVPATEAATGGEDAAAPVDSNLAEAIWVAYCWPSVRGTTGFRAFMVNQSGAIMQTDNVVQGYTGYTTPITPDAAFTSPNNIASPVAFNAAGNDGGIWKPVR